MADQSDLRHRRLQGYETARPDVQRLIPTTASRILELGCASGALGAALKARQNAHIVGVEIDAAYAADAADRLDRVVVADVEAFAANNEEPPNSFDCLLAADVLEHLRDPWATLQRLTSLLSPGAVVVVSVPNVRYWKALRAVIIGGTWPLEDSGVFDRTHLRWFTERDAVQLVTQAGFVDPEIYPQIWEKTWVRGRQRHLLRIVERSPARVFLPAQTLVRARLRDPLIV